jgi:YHS domain-containing protein
MRRITIAFFLLVLIAGAAAISGAADDTEKKQTTNKLCPVSGGPVSEKYRVEYNGQYVYVCCEGCVNEFKKNPETFVAKMSKEERELIKTNEVCPVSGEPIVKTKFVEFEGRKVYFCCDGCIEKYKKDHPSAK